MKALDVTLRTYVAARADRISENDSDLLVTRVLARPAPRGRWTRHSLNAAAAIVLSLLLIAGGIVLETQLHGLRFGAPAPSPGVLPTIPNEILDLDNASQGPDVVTPFRLKDQKVLDPRPRWIVAPGTAIMITSGGLCDLTVIHVVDLGSPPHDTRQPVSLPDCYMTPTIVPNSTLVLLDHQVRINDANQDFGAVAYDWSAGRVVRTYPNVPPTFGGGLVSSDGARLYTINPHSVGELDITDLITGGVTKLTVHIEQLGLNAGGMALSSDGRTLYLNGGDALRLFDARTGKPGAVLAFKEARPTAARPSSGPARIASWVMSLLPSMSADAKEGFEPGHGIAVDPKGRWVAAIGADEPNIGGIWVFDTSGYIRLMRHIDVAWSLAARWRGITPSLDGSVLYALEAESQQGSIDVIDPHTGQVKKLVDPRFSGGILGIAGVRANSP
jgi:hypothetical protein